MNKNLVNFNQIINDTTVFFAQFIFPFRQPDAESEYLRKTLKKLTKIKPGKHKAKQADFHRLYVRLWQATIRLLKEDWQLRAAIEYLPHLQLLRRLNVYIEPTWQCDIFQSQRLAQANFFIRYFQLRHPQVQQQIRLLFQPIDIHVEML